MSITYKELAEVTCNFEDRDFWWWFITTDEIDIDYKTYILWGYTRDPIKSIVDDLIKEGHVKEAEE
tara:strand:- start:64 stop:261 length:198 start_codon:yes stop_codon:yes gene_type:complete